MTFSDLEIAVSQTSRTHGYIRDNVGAIWTPNAGKTQQVYSRELAGAMLREADEFFDRALILYLLRSHLREIQASTWAGVATYYSNYFSALSFVRLHMRSVTQLVTGPVFEVTVVGQAPSFRIQQRSRRQSHSELWHTYYEEVTGMAWPDAAAVADLAPALEALRFREQLYRERINYRPGGGFEEIYLTQSRYLKALKASLLDDGSAPLILSDETYTDRMAAQRLSHVANLLQRLRESRIDVGAEESLWRQRGDLVSRYAKGWADRRFGESLTRDAA